MRFAAADAVTETMHLKRGGIMKIDLGGKMSDAMCDIYNN